MKDVVEIAIRNFRSGDELITTLKVLVDHGACFTDTNLNQDTPYVAEYLDSECKLFELLLQVGAVVTREEDLMGSRNDPYRHL